MGVIKEMLKYCPAVFRADWEELREGLVLRTRGGGWCRQQEEGRELHVTGEA